MAEGDAKNMSPRGSFFVGLVLGLGLAFIIFTRQKTTYEGDIDKMRHELELTTNRVAEDHAQIAEFNRKLEELSKSKDEKK